MTDVGFFLLPNLVWSVGEITSFCAKKSPTFVFANEKWRLKLKHIRHYEGEKILIFLKRITFCNNISDLYVRTKSSIADETGRYHIQISAAFQVANLNKWCILEGVKEKLMVLYYNSCKQRPPKPFPDGYTIVCCFELFPGWLNLRNISQRIEADTNSVVSSESPDIINEDIGRLFNSPVLSDVVLICGDKKIYAHKAILSARSQVFAAIFRDTIKDSHEISDVEPSILEQLISFIYTGEVPKMSLDSVHTTYAAADMYGLETLKTKCGLFMLNNSKEDESGNGVSIDIDCEKTLKERTERHFANVRAVVTSEEWKRFSTYDPKLANDIFQLLVKRNLA